MTPTDTNLWHGYSLDTIHQLATTTARRATGRYALDPDDAYETAWGAIVEHLATTETEPAPRDVTAIAYRAINTTANRANHHHGTPRTWGAHQDTAANFRRYWELQRRASPSPEESIVDRHALAQIWPTLTSQQQQTLWALAVHDGDHRAAADVLGCSLGTFRMRLSGARAAYRALWHEHETPSRMWGKSGCRGRRNAMRILADRRQERARRAAA